MTQASRARLSASFASAAVAEVAYHERGAAIAMDVVLPLVWGGAPALALPYARRSLARALAACEVVVVLSDPRLARKGWEPLAASVAFQVTADPEGTVFMDEGLLGQELVKHPPSRALADTPILRREHWWYLPRLLLRATHVGDLRPVGERAVGDGVLACTREGVLVADSVSVESWDAEPVRVEPLSGAALADGEPVPAALLGHEFSVPDREQSAQRLLAGTLRGAELRRELDRGDLELGRPPGLWTRLRRLRALERACRAELA